MSSSWLESIHDAMFRECAEIFDALSLQYIDGMRLITGKTVQGKHLVVLPLHQCKLALQLGFF